FTGENERSLYAATFNWARAARKLAVDAGVPSDKIIMILTSKSTHDDAVLSKEICLQNHFKSLIVVSEPYHTRRAFFTLRKVYRNTGINLMMYPVQHSWYTKDSWWGSEEGFFVTLEEYTKFSYYLFKGYL
ncbi:MAG: YdcF family protein, partial [Endomicrobiales bacterium]